MAESTPDSTRRSWWLALAALTACGPWPGWHPHPAALLVVCAGLVVLARPRGRRWLPWLPWLAVLVAPAVLLLQPAGKLDPQRLQRQLDAHCDEMLAVATQVAEDPRLHRLLAASGEAFKPELPFEVLRRQLRGRSGRTLYLADDRNRLVAWAGLQRAFPYDLRPLGDRRWGISWSAGSATLYIREPLLLEGRLVGAVTVADRTPLSSDCVWRMQAPRGSTLVLGGWCQTPRLPFGEVSGSLARRAADVVALPYFEAAQRSQRTGEPARGDAESDTSHLGMGADSPLWLQATGKPAVELPLSATRSTPVRQPPAVWLPWLVLAAMALVLAPETAWAVVLLAAASYLLGAGPHSDSILAVLVLGAAAACSRLAQQLPPLPARLLVGAALLAAAATGLLGTRWEVVSWLPTHLLRPGWGGVWMVAMAWLVAAWPVRQSETPLTLARRLLLAFSLAVLGVLLGLARMPIELQRASVVKPTLSLPRGGLELDTILPVAAEHCRLHDLAPVLAQRWRLDRWHTPSELLVVGDDGTVLSRWSDLEQAGESARLLRSWPLAELAAQVELWVASEPWSLLYDWRPGLLQEVSWTGNVWYAVLSRSGTIEATRHPQIRNLEAAVAGDLFYSKKGWTMMTVGEVQRLAWVWRRGDRLVAAMVRPSSPSVWVVRAALACVWALIGLTVARPPSLRWQQTTTFGGRLRLLVAGGVVLPLIILTLFLQQRLQREGVHIEQVMGHDALRTARYTAIHLAGGLAINDELARWLAAQLGGEVVLFDGAEVVAVSRPDLMAMGALPELPAAEAFPHFQLGRNDPIVLRQQSRLTAAGAIELQGMRLLAQVFPADPLQTGEAPEAVDWLLTGAVLAALLALVLTSRVERRLSTSLDDLVALARRLQSGETVGSVRQPQETDLAEVLDAVRLMSEEVQERERNLRSQEELLRITLSTLVPAVMVLDSAGGVRFANPSAELLQEEHGDRVRERIQHLVDRSELVRVPVIETYRPFPGEELTWRIGVASVPLPGGSRGMVAVVDDVTDVVSADRLRQLNQMARIVAHEVKNPLTPIRLWVQELEEAQRRDDPGLEQLLSEACHEISQQVERLQDLASSFSNLVALESWQPEVVDLAVLSGETLRGFSVLERRGVRLQPEIPKPGTALVMGDRQWLRRALDNLVKNSIDALADTAGEITLRVYRDEQGTRVIVEVEDSAGGVPEEQLKDLFSPSFSTTTKGSGLGLALVHQVVSRCQGRISAKNGARGLVVRLELPRSSGTIAL